MTDPRFQLYTAANETLVRLEHDFFTGGLGAKYEWTGHFGISTDYERRLPFYDPKSSIKADEAVCTAIYRRDTESRELTVHLKLFSDGSPYCRDEDLPNAEGGYYNVELALMDVPPSMMPMGVYESLDQDLSDLHTLTRAGVGEVLGRDRAQTLIDALSTFSIEQVDLSIFEEKRRDL